MPAEALRHAQTDQTAQGAGGQAVVTVLALLAFGFYLAAAVLLVRLEAGMRWRDLLWKTISSHALGAGQGRFDTYGVVMIAGVLCQVAATALHGAFGWAVPVWMLVLVLMLAGLLMFRTDSHGVEPGHHPVRARQREGYIHLYFASGCFGTAGIIVLLAEPKMGLLVSGLPLRVMDWTAIVVTAMLTMLAVTGFWRPLQGWFGLAERGFFYAAAGWFVLAALALAFGSPMPPTA